MGKYPVHGNLCYRHPMSFCDDLTAAETFKIIRTRIACHCKRIQIVTGMIRILAFHPAGEKSSAQRCIRDHRHLIFFIPCSGLLIFRSGDVNASTSPRIFDLSSQTEVRTGNRKRDQVVFVGIFIGLLDPCMCPVRRTKRTDVSFFMHGIKRLHSYRHIGIRIIPVKHININIIGFQLFQ